MNNKQKQKAILIFLVLILFVVNYSFLDSALENFLKEDGEFVIVERVIDGDTIVVNTLSGHENLSRGGTSVRLLGINCPEKGEVYFDEAKNFVEELVLNKKVVLKFGKDKYDLYDRILAYVFVDGKNVNLEIVENGLANFYFPSGKDIYYEDFKTAWEDCVEENLNLCEKSEDKCSDCVELKEFNYQKEIVTFFNKCYFDCEITGWEIKDEGRKNFVFPKFVLEKNSEVKVVVSKEDKINNQEEIFWIRKTYVWTKTGDTLFLRDSNGKLVLWRVY